MRKLLTFLFALLLIAKVYGQAEPLNYKVVVEKFKYFYRVNLIENNFNHFTYIV